MKLNLLKILTDKGLTPYRVHKDTGIAAQLLYQWVKGTGMPSWENLDTLCDYLGCGIEELLIPEAPQQQEKAS